MQPPLLAVDAPGTPHALNADAAGSAIAITCGRTLAVIRPGRAFGRRKPAGRHTDEGPGDSVHPHHSGKAGAKRSGERNRSSDALPGDEKQQGGDAAAAPRPAAAVEGTGPDFISTVRGWTHAANTRIEACLGRPLLGAAGIAPQAATVLARRSVVLSAPALLGVGVGVRASADDGSATTAVVAAASGIEGSGEHAGAMQIPLQASQALPRLQRALGAVGENFLKEEEPALKRARVGSSPASPPPADTHAASFFSRPFLANVAGVHLIDALYGALLAKLPASAPTSIVGPSWNALPSHASQRSRNRLQTQNPTARGLNALDSGLAERAQICGAFVWAAVAPTSTAVTFFGRDSGAFGAAERSGRACCDNASLVAVGASDGCASIYIAGSDRRGSSESLLWTLTPALCSAALSNRENPPIASGTKGTLVALETAKSSCGAWFPYLLHHQGSHLFDTGGARLTESVTAVLAIGTGHSLAMFVLHRRVLSDDSVFAASSMMPSVCALQNISFQETSITAVQFLDTGAPTPADVHQLWCVSGHSDGAIRLWKCTFTLGGADGALLLSIDRAAPDIFDPLQYHPVVDIGTNLGGVLALDATRVLDSEPAAHIISFALGAHVFISEISLPPGVTRSTSLLPLSIQVDVNDDEDRGNYQHHSFVTGLSTRTAESGIIYVVSTSAEGMYLRSAVMLSKERVDVRTDLLPVFEIAGVEGSTPLGVFGLWQTPVVDEGVAVERAIAYHLVRDYAPKLFFSSLVSAPNSSLELNPQLSSDLVERLIRHHERCMPLSSSKPFLFWDALEFFVSACVRQRTHFVSLIDRVGKLFESTDTSAFLPGVLFVNAAGFYLLGTESVARTQIQADLDADVELSAVVIRTRVHALTKHIERCLSEFVRLFEFFSRELQRLLEIESENGSRLLTRLASSISVMCRAADRLSEQRIYQIEKTSLAELSCHVSRLLATLPPGDTSFASCPVCRGREADDDFANLATVGQFSLRDFTCSKGHRSRRCMRTLLPCPPDLQQWRCNFCDLCCSNISAIPASLSTMLWDSVSGGHWAYEHAAFEIFPRLPLCVFCGQEMEAVTAFARYPRIL